MSTIFYCNKWNNVNYKSTTNFNLGLILVVQTIAHINMSTSKTTINMLSDISSLNQYNPLRDNFLLIIISVSGGSEVQESLKKFTNFLETEASRGRISRALEKKILGKMQNTIRVHILSMCFIEYHRVILYCLFQIYL